MNRISAIHKHSIPYIRFLLLPILLAVYPALFHYGNNINAAPFSSFVKLLALFAGLATTLYALFCLAWRSRALQAANAVFIFMLFFHTYGLAFIGMRSWDIVRVEHYTLLPLFVLLGFQMAWLIGRPSTKLSHSFWQGAAMIIGVLIAINLVKIASVKIRIVLAKTMQPATAPAPNPTGNQIHPNIYYIVFDEMAGFDAMRQYWHYNGVDSLVEYLKLDGFYVAENSHSDTQNTFHELANRLNYQNRPYVSGDSSITDSDLAALADNKVIRYLKSLGYTTVAFSELRSDIIFPAAPPIKADFLYEKPETGSSVAGFEDFTRLVMGGTMFKPFIADINLAAIQQHKNMIYFTVDKLGDLKSIPEPKFVFVHLALPHEPFLFEGDGSLNPAKDYRNWNKYLGNYIFAMQIARKVVDNILASADLAHPPVIIIQSDHGARNGKVTPQDILLPNYPVTYKTLIVNAIDIPGCDMSVLTQDIDPINTFPVVFNCYFNAGLPLK